MQRPATARAVFLDRDGVLNLSVMRDGRPVAPRSLEEFSVHEQAKAAAQRLVAAGYLLVVVTNQPDVGNGLTPESEVRRMNAELARRLPLTAIEACFHRQTDGCGCRKPKPGMLLKAASDFNIDLGRSVMVGDRASDVAAGQAAGCLTVLIDHGHGEDRGCRPDIRVTSLDEAVAGILAAGDRNAPAARLSAGGR